MIWNVGVRRDIVQVVGIWGERGEASHSEIRSNCG